MKDSTSYVTMDDGTIRVLPTWGDRKFRWVSWQFRKLKLIKQTQSQLNASSKLGTRIREHAKDLKRFGYLLENRPSWCARYR